MVADHSGRRRARAVFVALTLVFFVLVFRLYDLQISGHETFSRARDRQSRGFLDVRPPRGIIFDRRGDALAVSAPVASIAADPSRVADREGSARRLAAALGMEASGVLRLLGRTRPGPYLEPPPVDFVWIRRHVTAAEAEAVKRLAIPGVELRTEFDRVYPRGRLLAHVLGLVNIDDVGGEGIERALNGWLGGKGRRAEVDMDGRRRTLSWPDRALAGANLHLTVDAEFQRVVEEALDAAVERHRPNWAVAVAIDPRTGEILALANRPAYDPNRPVAGAALRNLAVASPFEPGSTWKPFAIAGALEAGIVTPASIVDCEMGAWRHGRRVLHDHHPYGRLSVSDVVAKSSNIGAAKIGGVLLGAERLWKVADAFGFGRRTGADLTPESPGTLHPLARWNDFSITSVPMGHEISVTALQLVVAMSAIANGGRLVRPYVVDRIVAADGSLLGRAEPEIRGRAASERTCALMRKMLREAVKSGTGTKAAVEGLEVAGKTGTTQKVDPATGRYTHEKFISSFVGFAPAEGARICVAVILDEPKGEYYGGTVAAPVVAEILKDGMKFIR
jgi:cell division protein FtsI (penicillin-binding protein 3)